MAERPGLVREIAEWLEVHGGGDTLEARDTIVPPTIREPRAGGADALALLRRLAGHAPTSSAQLRTGEVIAEGGMGVIRLAEQVPLGRIVAVKTLKAMRRGDARAAIDLLREAWITGAIDHPNVVPVHHVGLDDTGSPLIVLKRIAGAAWSELIDDGAEVERRFGATDLLAWNIGILMQVLNALRGAHQRGIVHRDVKPSNVMIGELGEVYLLDWGIAVSLRDDGSGRLPLAIDTTELAGTPAYMAPELLGREGGAPVTERCDVYLAGAVLYEIITGRPPHEGTNALEVLTNVATTRPALPATAPPELARICLEALQYEPADRYASAEALRLALQRYLEHRGSSRLADLARERLDRLLALVATARRDPGLREQIHRLFGACRFGFHEALAGWRDNTEARAGLERAIVAVAEYEVAYGDPRAAVHLLSELEPAPPDVLARARAAAEVAQRRQDDLERLERQLDTTIGSRTRTLFVMVLGTLFVGLPLLAAAIPELPLRDRPELYSLGFLGLVLGFGVWARESMRKTLFNRRIYATAVLLFAAQALMCAGAWSLGFDLARIEAMMVILWTVTTGMVAIALDPRLAPAPVAFALVFVVVSRYPEHRLYAMCLGNLVFTVTAVWHWTPARARSRPRPGSS